MRRFKPSERYPAIPLRMRDFNPLVWFTFNEGWNGKRVINHADGRIVTADSGGEPNPVRYGRYDMRGSEGGICLGRGGYPNSLGTWPELNDGYTLCVNQLDPGASTQRATWYLGFSGANRHYVRGSLGSLTYNFQLYDGGWHTPVWFPGGFSTSATFEKKALFNFCLVYNGTDTVRWYAYSPNSTGIGDADSGIVYRAVISVAQRDLSADIAFLTRCDQLTSSVGANGNEFIVLDKQFDDGEAADWVRSPETFWDLPRRYYAIPAGGPPPANDVLVDVPEAYVDVRGYNPGVEILIPADDNVLVNLPAAPIQVTGIAPTVGIANDVFTDVPAAQVDVQGAAPQVNIGDDTLVTLPAAQIQVQGFGPTVDAGADILVDLPAAQIDVQGRAPDVLVEENVFVDLPAAQVSVQGVAPTTVLVGDVLVSLPAAEVRVIGTGPRVVVGEPDDAPSDGGIAHGPASEVAVEPTSPVIT